MSHADIVAVIAVPPHARDDAISGGLDWRADWRGKIDAAVQSGITKDRVVAHAEGGRNARAVDWRHSKESPSTLANAVIPGRQRFARRLKREEKPCPEARVDGHEQSFAGANGVTLLIEDALEHNFGAVGGTDIALEIEIVTAGIGQLGHFLVGRAQRDRAIVEAVANHRIDAGDLKRQRNPQLTRRE